MVPKFALFALLIALYLVLQLISDQSARLDSIFFIVILCIVFPDLLSVLFLVKEVVSLLSQLMLALVPVFSSILFILHGVLAIFNFNPIVLLIVQAIIFLVDKLFIPALLMALFFDIWTCGIKQISFSKAASFIRSFLIISITFLMMLLTALITISSSLIITLSNTLTSPLKRMLEQAIPVVGSVIVQALSLMKKTQFITSSFAGASAILALVAVLAVPIGLLIAYALFYKLLAIFCEPFMPPSITELFDYISKNLFLLCGIVAIVFCSIVIIIMLILMSAYIVTRSV